MGHGAWGSEWIRRFGLPASSLSRLQCRQSCGFAIDVDRGPVPLGQDIPRMAISRPATQPPVITFSIVAPARLENRGTIR
jgi:hypothetical protein